MPFSFYDILDESAEEEQFNSNILLEDEFDIEVPDKYINSLKTIGDVIKFIEKNE